jgi:hypothetical protein
MKIFYNNEAKQINIADERFYESLQNPGVFFPSVTTILDAYYKGYGFHEWLKQVGFSADEILRKAGDQGTHVHEMIDLYLKGMPVRWLNENGIMLYTLDEWQMFNRFIDFWTKFVPELLINEFNIVSETLKFGGTIDFIGTINNEIWLIDWKTSNAIHKTHELQIAAYAMAWNELNPKYKVQRTGILWLKSMTRGEDKKGKNIQGENWILKEFDRNYEEAFELFKHTQAIWNEENPNYKPKNLVYQTEFQLKKEEPKPSETLF